MRPMLLAAVVAASLPAVALAQQPKPDTYLLLVAAAVSGYSAGGPVWVVICETRGEYKVLGAFGTEAEARAAADAKRTQQTSCYVEGPYTSTTSFGAGDILAMKYGGGCKKGPDSDCVADSTAALIAPLGSIRDVTLTYRFRDGRPPVSEQFDPRTVEAIFFTMPAVDRMLVPYYVRVYGLSGALQRRRALLTKFGGRDAN